MMIYLRCTSIQCVRATGVEAWQYGWHGFDTLHQIDKHNRHKPATPTDWPGWPGY